MPRKPKWDAAFDLACVHKETLSYCRSLPNFIQTHGNSCVGEIAVALGNYFVWIAPALDAAAIPQIESPTCERKSVLTLGQRFQTVGLELWDKKTEGGKIGETLAELKQHVLLLETIARMRGER